MISAEVRTGASPRFTKRASSSGDAENAFAPVMRDEDNRIIAMTVPGCGAFIFSYDVESGLFLYGFSMEDASSEELISFLLSGGRILNGLSMVGASSEELISFLFSFCFF